MHTFFLALIILCLFGLSLSTTHAEVYKQVNPDGSITFTDVPKSKDAKPVPIKPMSTFKASTAPSISSSAKKSKSDKTKYTSVSITNPANEATIRDNSGNFSVTASVDPALQSGHKMVLMDNGANKGESASGSFKLSNVDRGAHTLSIQIQNSKGKVLLSSDPVTVYLHRSTGQ